VDLWGPMQSQGAAYGRRCVARLYSARASVRLAALGALGGLLATVPAGAMPAAVGRGGVDFAAALGPAFGGGTRVGGDAEFDYSPPGGEQFAWETLSEIRSAATEPRQNVSLSSVGIIQPLIRGGTAFSLEGGVSYTGHQVSPGIVSVSPRHAGAYFGAIVTLQRRPDSTLTGLVRYHALGKGIWQVGVATHQPLEAQLGWQAEAYVLDAGGLTSATVLTGIRWFIPTGPARSIAPMVRMPVPAMDIGDQVLFNLMDGTRRVGTVITIDTDSITISTYGRVERVMRDNIASGRVVAKGPTP
jgi:hypothetical protein